MQTVTRAETRLDLPTKIYTAVVDYTRLAGVSPSLHDLPIIVDAPLSVVRQHVQLLIARGHLAGPLDDLKAVIPPVVV